METELNSLPDEILGQVLSFMDTRDAVRTSVLSRRWRHLWLYLSTFRICSDSFADYPSFSSFIAHLLLRFSLSPTPLSLCTFSFDISNPIYSSRLDVHDLFDPLVSSLIRHLHYRGANHISLLFPRIVDNLHLIFRSPSLSSLHLHQLVILPISFNRGPSSLTTLRLVNCSFVIHCQDFFDPFKDFVSLTTLSICGCRIPSKVKFLKISAPQLTHLTISDMEHDRNVGPDCTILLSSPKIASFNFTASHVLRLSTAPSPSLPCIERTYLDVTTSKNLFVKYPLPTDGKNFISRLLNMFRVVGGAKSVTLSLQTTRSLALFPDALRLSSPLTGMEIFELKVPSEPGPFNMPADVICFLLSGSPYASFKVEFGRASTNQEQGKEKVAGFPKFVR